MSGIGTAAQSASQPPPPLQQQVLRSKSPTSTMANIGPTQQQIIRSNLEMATRPIFQLIKNFSDDFLQSVSQSSLSSSNDPSTLSLQQECLSTYSKPLENLCYALMKFTLEFSLTDNDIQIPLSVNVKDSVAHSLCTYIHQIKQHMSSTAQTSQRQGSLKSLLQRLFKLSKHQQAYESLESDEEGFFDAECDDNDENMQNADYLNTNTAAKFFKIQSSNNRFPPSQKVQSVVPPTETSEDPLGVLLRKQIEDLTAQKVELELRLKTRDESIEQLTSGYVKDIQHMKEMIFRQQRTEEAEFYQVQYFDSTTIADETTRQALNGKLKEIKSQFEKKTAEIMKKIYVLNSENDKLKKSNQQQSALIANITASSSSSSADSALVEMFKKAFSMEENPYKVWKALQEIKGNQFFFTVFENQKPEYGINYKEVNKMLISKKGYEKEYSEYKLQIDDQVCNLIAKTSSELQEFQNEFIMKEAVIEDLYTKLEEARSEQNDTFVAHTQVLLAQKELDVKQKLEEQKQLFSKKSTQSGSKLLRFAFLRWSITNQAIKACDPSIASEEQLKELVQKLLRDDFQKSQVELKLKSECDFFKAEMKRLQGLVDQVMIEKSVRKHENFEFDQRLRMLQIKLQQQNGYISTLKRENNELIAKKSIIETTLTQIFAKISDKLGDEQFEDIDLENEKKHSTKIFLKKIKQFEKKQWRVVREISIASEKMKDARSIMMQPETTQNVEVQTILYGVGTQYSEFDKQHRQHFEDEGSLLANRPVSPSSKYIEVATMTDLQTTNAGTQSIMQGSDIEELQSELIELKEIITLQNQEMRALQEVSDKLAEDKEKHEKQQAEIESTLKSIKELKESIESKLLDAQIQLQTQIAKTVEAETKVAEQLEKKEALEKEITDLNANIRNVQQQLQSAQQQIQQLQQQLQQQQQNNYRAPATQSDPADIKNARRFSNTRKSILLSNLNSNQEPANSQKHSSTADNYTVDDSGQPDNNSEFPQNQGANITKPNSSKRMELHRLSVSQQQQQPDISTTENNTANMNAPGTHKDDLKSIKHVPRLKLRKKEPVFDRLFNDSKDKQERMEQLKKQLQRLETFHWEEVLSILHLYTKQLQAEFLAYPDTTFRFDPSKLKGIGSDSNSSNGLYSAEAAASMRRHTARGTSSQPEQILLSSRIPNNLTPTNFNNRAEFYFRKPTSRDTHMFTKATPTTNAATVAAATTSPGSAAAGSGAAAGATTASGTAATGGQIPISSQGHNFDEQNATFSELNQDSYERRKMYLEQVFDSFRRHTARIQAGGLTKKDEGFHIMNNSGTRQKSLQSTNRSANSGNEYEDDSQLYLPKHGPNQMQSHTTSNFNVYQHLNKSSLEANNLYEQNQVSTTKTDSQTLYALSTTQPVKFRTRTTSSSNNSQSYSHIGQPLDLATAIQKEKAALKKQQQESTGSSSSSNQVNASKNHKSVMLPESIFEMVKSSKASSIQFNL